MKILVGIYANTLKTITCFSPFFYKLPISQTNAYLLFRYIILNSFNFAGFSLLASLQTEVCFNVISVCHSGYIAAKAGEVIQGKTNF